MIPEVAVSSRVTKWNLLNIIAAIIGLIDTCTNYSEFAPPSHKALFFTALLADYVALVLSSRLFFEQLAAKTLSSSTSLLLTVWLAIVFWKAWTTEFTCEPDVMRQLYGVAILCCILIHLAEKVWLRIPYAKFSQLRPLDKLHAGVVFVGYWLWVCRVYPNWDTHIRHFTALWISTAVLTVVSVYVKRSSWHAGDSDAKPVPLLPISSVCHDLVHAIANTTVSMFWTMEAIAQAKGGAAGDYLMCVVSVIVSLVHIGMSLQIWWQNDDRENYACRLTINYRDPKEVLRPFGNIMNHHIGYITTLNRYNIYMLIRWLGNFLLFVFGVSRLNLGFLCNDESAFPAASASCIMGNIASAFGMMLSQACILQPKLLAMGNNWGVPPRKSDNSNSTSWFWSVSFVACSFLHMIGWLLIFTFEKGWLIRHPHHLPAILLPLLLVFFGNCNHIWLFYKNVHQVEEQSQVEKQSKLQV